jgi:hypothetical protein
MVDLIPVDHDPFAPPQLVPVDHDPWAASANDQMSLAAGQMVADAAQAHLAARGQDMLDWGDRQQALNARLAGLPLGEQIRDPEAMGNAMGIALSVGGPGAIRAFHASPYDFDQFDISKVGTGQGAASFGHGIYGAENPAVSGLGGQYDREFTAKNLGKPDLNQLEDYILRSIRSGKDMPGVMQDLAENHPYLSFDEAVNQYQRVNAAKAKIYDTQINADPEHFLDWDKPLSEQHPIVENAVADLAAQHRIQMGNATGARAYNAIAEGLAQKRPEPPPSWTSVPGGPVSYDAQVHDPTAAANALRDAGIPGIRYLDQGSRGAGEGTHNYVVFDDKLIDIIKKYGLAGLIAGGAATVGGSPAGATHLIPVDHDPFAGATP